MVPPAGLVGRDAGKRRRAGGAGSCDGDISPKQQNQGGPKDDTNSQRDLKIDKACWIDTAGTYVFGNINIIGPKGSLEFREPAKKGTLVNVWAKNIIVENGGTLKAGTATAPYGSRAGVLTIYLYGDNQSHGHDPNVDANQGQGVLCQTKIAGNIGPCGIPTGKLNGKELAWSDNGANPVHIDGYPADDYFYQYGPLYGDMRCTNPDNPDDQTFVLWQNGACTNPSFQPGYFGYKVLGVAYGGSLELFGYKGTPLPKAPPPKHTVFNPFGNQGLFNPQGTTGPSQFAAQNAPENSQTDGSAGSVFLKFIHSHFGNGGGGNGGGGHPCPSPSPNSASTASCGGGGGGGDDVTCATGTPDDVPTSTGCSWLRLALDLATEGKALSLSNETGDRWFSPDDPTPDEVVVTTTDYLPGHSEKRTITAIAGNQVTLSSGVTWPHRGSRFELATRLGTNSQRFLDAGMDPDLITNGAETRAAVALLTRSIRIVSGGRQAGASGRMSSTGPNAGHVRAWSDLRCRRTCYSFGAHVVFRQGFKPVQIQGVEFAKMGQPGKLGHYPVHFHMARQVPPNTFIKDFDDQ